MQSEGGGVPLATARAGQLGQRWPLLADGTWGAVGPRRPVGRGRVSSETPPGPGACGEGGRGPPGPLRGWLGGVRPRKRIPPRYATGVGEEGPCGRPKQAPPGSRV